MSVSFEIQTLYRGQWMIDSVYGQRDEAVSEALKLGQNERFTAIRVVEEHYDEKSQLATRSKTILKLAQEQKKKNGQKADDVWRDEAAIERQIEEARRRRLAHKPADALLRERDAEWTLWIGRLVLQGAVIAALGVGFFVAGRWIFKIF